MQTSSQTTVNVNNYPNGLFPAAQGPGVQGRRHLETANCVCLPPGNGGNVANDAGADNSDPSSRTPNSKSISSQIDALSTQFGNFSRQLNDMQGQLNDLSQKDCNNVPPTPHRR